MSQNARPVGVYLRGDAAISLDEQRRRCTEFVEIMSERMLAAGRAPLVVEQFYIDQRSASLVSRARYHGSRPAFDTMLADTEAGRICGWIAESVDRLYRRPAELERIVDVVEQHDVFVATVEAGPFDFGTADGRLAARIVGTFARYENERAGARQRAAAAQRRAQVQA